MFKLVQILFFLVFTWMLIAPFLVDYNKPTLKAEKKPQEGQAKKTQAIEKPLHSVELPDFASIKNIAEKKRAFFNFLAPAIEKENARLLQLREKLLTLAKQKTQGFTANEQAFIRKVAQQFRVKPNISIEQQLDELIKRVDQVPEPLVLVQAANESAWGTSRFARIGLNFFGIWCYTPKCGMIPKGRTGNDKHEVAAFQSVEQAVQGYFYNLNTHPAYQTFRDIRAHLRAENQPLYPEILASGLLAYSERGEHYVVEIAKMIEQNQAFFPQTVTLTAAE